jgi:hypothetical protein
VEIAFVLLWNYMSKARQCMNKRATNFKATEVNMRRGSGTREKVS